MKIKINPLFYIIVVFFIVTGRGLLLLGYIVSVIVHEGGHKIVAKCIGYNLGNINLMPYGGKVAGFKYNKAIDGIIISISGPIANFVFALLVMSLWWVSPIIKTSTEDLVLSSIALGIINLMPIYPLDGSQFVFLISKNKIVTSKILKVFSIIFGIIFISLSVISIIYSFNITLCVFGIFTILSTFLDRDKMIYDYIYINSLKTKNLDFGVKYVSYAVSVDCPLYKILGKINVNEICEFRVYDKEKELGIIKEKDLERCIENFSIDRKAIELLELQ